MQSCSHISWPTIRSLAYPATKIICSLLTLTQSRRTKSPSEQNAGIGLSVNSRELLRLFAFCFLCLLTQLNILAWCKLFMDVPFHILQRKQRLAMQQIWQRNTVHRSTSPVTVWNWKGRWESSVRDETNQPHEEGMRGREKRNTQQREVKFFTLLMSA